MFAEDAVFYDFQDFEPISSTIATLEDHATEPNNGLFDTNYTHETVVNFSTAMTVDNDEGDSVKVGQELVLIAPNNTRWRLSVDSSGTLITTQET